MVATQVAVVVLFFFFLLCLISLFTAREWSNLKEGERNPTIGWVDGEGGGRQLCLLGAVCAAASNDLFTPRRRRSFFPPLCCWQTTQLAAMEAKENKVHHQRRTVRLSAVLLPERCQPRRRRRGPLWTTLPSQCLPSSLCPAHSLSWTL